MTEILRQKIIKLVRGDDGVALVVTLALFMFLYVSCAGVYTVGRAVKDRIILQNAVDAAAYSAAVVQADYLSRIATINKAMAWNYVQFIKSQKNWISLSFLNAVYHETWAFNGPIEIVAGSKVTPQTKETLAALIAGKSIDDYEGEIEEYHSRLSAQQGALNALRDRMVRDMSSAATDVLRANLPWRIGELCRFEVNAGNVLQYMGGQNEENRFIDVSGQDTGSNPTWFEFSGNEGFGRDVLGVEKLYAMSWQRSNDGFYWSPAPVVDAFLRFIPQLVPHHGFEIQPLKLADGQFFPGGSGANGAVTVAVAKWNENPWTGLVRDLTGIHATFDYGKQNDWTFAIASAQAGYRDNTDPLLRKYSVNPKSVDDPEKYNFDSVTLGKAGGGAVDYDGQDWDAVYVPVRMAFGSNGGAFASWMGAGAWGQLVPDGQRKYVLDPLPNIRFGQLNNAALARMHNNGGMQRILEWNNDGARKFLDLMYH